MTDVVLVLTTVPSTEVGEAIAEALVGERLAACANVLPAMTSVYRWQGAVEQEVEHQMVIKSTADRVAAVQARITELHPYDLPEFLVLAADAGSAPYLAWVAESTRKGV